MKKYDVFIIIHLISIYIFCGKDKTKLFSLLLNIYTQQTLKAHCLFSKPWRSLQKVQRTYNFKYAYSLP